MAAPAFSTATAQGNAAATTTPSVTVPTTAANDILLLVRINGGATALAAPGGTYSGGAWTTIDSDTWTTGAGGVMWSRCTGNHVTETVTASTTDSGSLLLVRITGAITTGSPIGTVTGVTLGAVSGGALTGFTTTAIDTLVVYTGAADDNAARSSPTMGGNAMSNLSGAASTGGADSCVWYADTAQASPGATGNFDITHAAGTVEGKRVSAFAVLSVRSVVLGTSAAQSTSSLALTAGAATTGEGRVELGTLDAPEAGTQMLSIRARASVGSGILRTTLYDSDGSTARGTDDFTLTGSFQTFTLNPSGITDYSALQVGFEGIGSGLTAEVSWIEFRVPESSGAAAVDVPLDPSVATSSASLALTAKTTVTLQSAGAVSVTSLALTAPSSLSLSSGAQSTATLALTAQPTVALQTSAATSTATLALSAPTTVALDTSAAQSAATLNLVVPRIVPLGASAATSTATLALEVLYNVQPSPAVATSTATLALTAKPRLTFTSAGVSDGTLVVSPPTVLVLDPSHGQSSATLFSIGGPPAEESHPDLAGIFDQLPTGGDVYAGRLTDAGGLLPSPEQVLGDGVFPATSTEMVRHPPGTGGIYDQSASDGVVYIGRPATGLLPGDVYPSDVLFSGGEVERHGLVRGAALVGPRGGVVQESTKTGDFNHGVRGGDVIGGALGGVFDGFDTYGEVPEPVTGGELVGARGGAVDESGLDGEHSQTRRDGDVL